jgi:ubiquinone/menaquinone biosynthesis C-methylase UbiE
VAAAVDPHQETSNLEKYSRQGLEGRLLSRFRRRLLEVAIGLEPASILDAGCGEGVATGWLADALPDAEVRGLEARPEAIAEAERRVPRASFSQGDLYDMPFPDEAFDLVVCVEVLEHLERPADGLRELLRVSAEHVLVTVPHEPFFRAGNLARGRYVRRLGSTPGHLNTWGRRGIAKLVCAQARDVRVIEMFPWLAVLARR